MEKSLYILIVEDSEDDTLLLMRELKRGGFKPVYQRVETSGAMKSALAERRWDLIVTDYTMPHFNALAALTVLKESGFDIPFIIVSGTIGEERAVAAMKAGAHDYLKKGELARLNPIIQRELREANIRQEQRMAGEMLREQERYFRTLIENNSDIIITLDSSGTILYTSPAFERILGHTSAETNELNLFSIVHPDDLGKNQKAFTALIEKPGQQINVQFQIKHKDNSWVWVEAIISNFLDEAGINAMVANLRDVTERHNLQTQLLQAQKMEAIGQLTAGIAHDFNNMLTVINNYAQLLQYHLPKDENLHRMANRILDGGNRAANLVRRLLTFSRKQIIAPEILDLNKVVTRTDSMLEQIIGEHIVTTTNLAPDLWSIRVDPTQIEQIILNLVVNARDAMPTGGTLTIETSNEYLSEDFPALNFNAKSGYYVMLMIEDNGMGMTDEVKAHLYEPFFTTKEMGKGTGLGLATVYGIVKQNRGVILVDSIVDQGTKVRIYFPRVRKGVPVEVVSPAPIKPARNNATILLVEDDASVRVLVNEILVDLGYEVLVARNGENALDLVDSYEGYIDLLLTDIVMPGLSGQVLAERLLMKQPNLKVLFMTGYSEDMIYNYSSGAASINLLQKPYKYEELVSRVQDILGEDKGISQRNNF